MRSTKLSPAVWAAAAATASLALAPAGAIAAPAHQSLAKSHKHAGVAGCRVSAFVEPHLVTSGEAVQVFGQLVCPGGAGAAVNQTITVYEHTAGTAGFKVVGTVTSAAGGFYSTVPGTISANSVFYARALGARSASRAVKVAPLVTLAGPAPDASQLKTGPHNRVLFTGTVSPSDAGAQVFLERENATSSEEWISIQGALVRADGTFSILHQFVVPGDANLRVIVRPHRSFEVRGTSNTLSYVIAQPQNPKLTINSSADPVSYGQPVTLSGVLAGGAGKKVTVFSRTAKQPFAKVEEVTADATGEYKFLIPAATTSTFYHVTSGGISSTVLFEGVKYLLTATAAPTTAQAGQPVTFAGTVTPGNAGKVVYLERENAFGGGFHVTNITTVTAASTYSITHFVFGSAKQVFRVKVPGDPANQAVSSATFPIEVTPAPAGTLRPKPQAVLPH
jgi:hypothetical protein